MLVTIAFALRIDINQLAMVFTQGMIGFNAPSLDSVILTIIVPIVLFGIMIGLTGKTPGKMLLKLRVQGFDNRPVGIKKGLLRKAIKWAAFTCLILGVVWAFYGLFTEGRTFYDEWLSLTVDDESYSEDDNLTDTQKSGVILTRNDKNQTRETGQVMIHQSLQPFIREDSPEKFTLRNDSVKRITKVILLLIVVAIAT
jgi:uncharacterized RDD family membrane protein YckC